MCLWILDSSDNRAATGRVVEMTPTIVTIAFSPHLVCANVREIAPD